MISGILKSITSGFTTTGNLGVNGHLTLADDKHIILAGTKGSKIGTATSQKLGFYGANPVDQPATVTDGSDAASTQAAVNAVIDRLQELGLIA